ncbi:MAG: hypothetical protein ACRDYX_00105 [Egibacteraceae bacterium]
MEQLLGDQPRYAQLIADIDQHRPTVTYETTTAPLLAFLERGAKAPDIGTARHDATVQALLDASPALTAAPMLPI